MVSRPLLYLGLIVLVVILIAGYFLLTQRPEGPPVETPTTSPVGTTPARIPVELIWASTQLSPAPEQEVVRGLLEEFAKETGIKVTFVPLGYAEMSARVEAEVTSGRVTISVIGALSTEIEFFTAKGWVEDLTRFGTLTGRTFFEDLEALSRIGGVKAYVPWMTATYVIVVNNKAFNYLPPGLTRDDVVMGTEKWTYEALLEWARRLKEATGRELVGFPAGAKGLFHRFLHGFLYPSFTGYQAREFNSEDAVRAWSYLSELWKYVHPASTTWDAMAEPLLKEEVWIAWDHVARVREAIVTKPEEFTVVPVPIGPKGRGYIIVLAGLAIPKGAPNQDAAWKLIEFMTRPEVQATILEKVGFFPTVKEAGGRVTGALKKMVDGVNTQLSAPKGIPVFIPSLGAKGGEFTAIYREAFERIVLRGEDARSVLNELWPRLKGIFEEVGVPLS